MLLRGKYGQGYATENAGVDTLNIEGLYNTDSCGQDDKKIFHYILYFLFKNKLLRANVGC